MEQKTVSFLSTCTSIAILFTLLYVHKSETTDSNNSIHSTNFPFSFQNQTQPKVVFQHIKTTINVYSPVSWHHFAINMFLHVYVHVQQLREGFRGKEKLPSIRTHFLCRHLVARSCNCNVLAYCHSILFKLTFQQRGQVSTFYNGLYL